MNKIIYNLRHNKFLLSLLIVTIAFAVLTLSCVIFDIVQLSVTANNSTKLSVAFIPFNISVIVLDVILLICYIIYFIVKSRSNNRI